MSLLSLKTSWEILKDLATSYKSISYADEDNEENIERILIYSLLINNEF